MIFFVVNKLQSKFFTSKQFVLFVEDWNNAYFELKRKSLKMTDKLQQINKQTKFALFVIMHVRSCGVHFYN